jgi:hypothetical protein
VHSECFKERTHSRWWFGGSWNGLAWNLAQRL